MYGCCNAPEAKSTRIDQYKTHLKYANIAIDNNALVEALKRQRALIDHASNIQDQQGDLNKALAKDLRKTSGMITKKIDEKEYKVDEKHRFYHSNSSKME